MIKEVSGNLLRDDAQALVNPVNVVGIMGKGLALQFRRAHPENFDAYAAACRDGQVRPGRIFTTPLGDGRWILNFPTKRHWRQASRLEDVSDGLDDLVRIIRELGLKSVAVPPLGCGNGGLPWTTVRNLIHEKLGSLDTEVRLYGPGTPRSHEMITGTTTPELDTRLAALLVSLRSYIDTALGAGISVGPSTSLLEAHKVMYLVNAVGYATGYRFERGHLGPYSAGIDRALAVMEGHYVLGFGDGTGGARADLRLLPAADEAARLFPDDGHLTLAWQRVSQVIMGYEYPDGMELLATVHYLATDGGASREVLDSDTVTRQVAEWSSRKRRLFPREDVVGAWLQLEHTGLLATSP